jgi:hypothetical protein
VVVAVVDGETALGDLLTASRGSSSSFTLVAAVSASTRTTVVVSFVASASDLRAAVAVDGDMPPTRPVGEGSTGDGGIISINTDADC